MTREEIIKFWIKSSDKDFRTMANLFRTEDYSWALFLGHLVIEKLLKAYYVKTVDINHPFIHDLLKIAERTDLTLKKEQEDFLDLVTTFNLGARYSDYKMKFYKKCTKKFTEKNIMKIKEFRQWLKNQLKK